MTFDCYHMMGDPKGYFHSIQPANFPNDDVVHVQMLNHSASSKSPITEDETDSLTYDLMEDPNSSLHYDTLMCSFKQESPSSYDLLMSFTYPGSCPSFFYPDETNKESDKAAPDQYCPYANSTLSLEPSYIRNWSYGSCGNSVDSRNYGFCGNSVDSRNYGFCGNSTKSCGSSSNSTLYDCTPSEVDRDNTLHLLRNTPWPGKYNTVAMGTVMKGGSPKTMWNSSDEGSDDVFFSDEEKKEKKTVVTKIKSFVKKLKK